MSNKITALIRKIFAILLLIVSAYALSFAIDLLIGGIFNVYPNTAFLPVITWSVVSIITFVFAIKITSFRSWFFIPFLIFGIIALLGALIGTHPHSFGVAIVMFIQAMIVKYTYKHNIKINKKRVIIFIIAVIIGVALRLLCVLLLGWGSTLGYIISGVLLLIVAQASFVFSRKF